jgi:2Fe-2S ferredoxin
VPTITFVEFDGTNHTIDAKSGVSLMENAFQNDVPGIDADCGGACACGTCHCMINHEWTGKVGEPNDMEESMLSMSLNRSDNSRLSCQIVVSDDMDGMIVQLPEYQM